MGIELLSNASALIAMRINGVAMQVDSVKAADQYSTFWQSATPGFPNSTLCAGLNLIALSPVPDLGVLGGTVPYSLSATVVENAPVPVAGTDLLQVGRDDLDCVIDYAQHLAALKMGGAEFTATLPLFQRFMSQATIYNRKLKEFGEYTDTILGLAQQEERRNPRMSPAEVTSG
jgi:hypothetical protein